VHAFPTEVVELDRGDAVLLFTDGVTEARDEQGRFYEDERLHADIVRFTRGRRLDDIAIALLRLT
jgi:serine phosphatase RsbU (regulator of sigma subunit)